MSFSFESADLQSYHVISTETQDRSLPKLNGTVHNIWRRANFVLGMTRKEQKAFRRNGFQNFPVDKTLHTEMYERMRPGLSLATSMLNHSRDFFITFINSNNQRKENGKLQFKVARTGKHMVLDGMYKKSNANKAAHEAALDIMMDDFSDSTCFFIPTKRESEGCWGLTDLSYGKKYDQNYLSFELDFIFYNFFSTSQFEKAKLEERRCFYLMLAITCVHELTHALWYKHTMPVWEDERQGKRFKEFAVAEPFYAEQDPFAELGHAWENFMFAGIISPLQPESSEDLNLSISHGGGWAPWGEMLEPMGGENWPLQYAVAAEAISRLVEERAWEEHTRRAARRNCGLPLQIALTPLRILTDHVIGSEAEERIFLDWVRSARKGTGGRAGSPRSPLSPLSQQGRRPSWMKSPNSSSSEDGSGRSPNSSAVGRCP